MNKLSSQFIIALFNDPKKCNQLTLAQWSAFIFVLRECDLLARFYHLAKNKQCFELFPDKVKHHLNSAKVKAERQAKQAIYEAVEMRNNLADIDVQPIFLKGVAYTLRKSTTSLGRVYSDMDILVDKKELRNIERKLSLFGWFTQKIDDYDEKYYRQWAHEIPPMQQSSRGTIADIHHNLLPPISGRAPDISLFTQGLHETSEGLYTLNKSAMVLHSIIHLFFNEEFSNGFRDLSDLHLMFSEENEHSAFWTDLVTLSTEAKFTTELYYSVRYCQKITNTQFPEKFLSLVNKHKVNSLRLTLADFIFGQVLRPNHPSCASKYSVIANSLAMLRGHLLKMPLHILLYHSLHKLFVVTKTLFEHEKSNKKATIQNAINKND